MPKDPRRQEPRDRPEAAHPRVQPREALTRQRPGLDHELPAADEDEEELGIGVIDRGEDVITSGEWRGRADDPGRPARH